MSTKTVRELLKEIGPKELYFTRPDSPIHIVAGLMELYNVGALVVLDGTKLVGIVSERDIVRKVVSENLDPMTRMVSGIMTTGVISVTPFTNLKECEDVMKEKGIRHLPVVENGNVIAIVSIRDLLVSTRKEQEDLVQHLKNYIMPEL